MASALGSGVLPRLSELATESANLPITDAQRGPVQRLAALLLARAVLQGDPIVHAAVIAFDGKSAIACALGGSSDDRARVKEALAVLEQVD